MIRLILSMCAVLLCGLMTRAADFDSANLLFMGVAGCVTGAVALSMLGNSVRHDHRWR